MGRPLNSWRQLSEIASLTFQFNWTLINFFLRREIFDEFTLFSINVHSQKCFLLVDGFISINRYQFNEFVVYYDFLATNSATFLPCFNLIIWKSTLFRTWLNLSQLHVLNSLIVWTVEKTRKLNESIRKVWIIKKATRSSVVYVVSNAFYVYWDSLRKPAWKRFCWVRNLRSVFGGVSNNASCTAKLNQRTHWASIFDVHN